MRNYYLIEMRIDTDHVPDIIRKHINKKIETKIEVLHHLREIGERYPLEIIRIKWIEQVADEINTETTHGNEFFALYSPVKTELL